VAPEKARVPTSTRTTVELSWPNSGECVMYMAPFFRMEKASLASYEDQGWAFNASHSLLGFDSPTLPCSWEPCA